MIDEIPGLEITIWKFTSQIGCDKDGLKYDMCPDPGELLLFCSINGLCIGNMYFVHKNFHKKT